MGSYIGSDDPYILQAPFKNFLGACFYKGVWCSGSTKDFGSFSLGSSPSIPTILTKVRRK